MRLAHWLAHHFGWNTGEVEVFWRGGYWYDGQRKEWSEARKIRAQNAGQTND